MRIIDYCHYHESTIKKQFCKQCHRNVCEICIETSGGLCWTCSYENQNGITEERLKLNKEKLKTKEHFISLCTASILFLFVFSIFFSKSINDFIGNLFYLILFGYPVLLFIAFPISIFLDWLIQTKVKPATDNKAIGWYFSIYILISLLISLTYLPVILCVSTSLFLLIPLLIVRVRRNKHITRILLVTLIFVIILIFFASRSFLE